MISTATQVAMSETVPARQTPLAQLLHALNQPLTGLQCSMEVALAAPRTAEQYVLGLRQGLELTERMRALVAAIREVVNSEALVGDEQLVRLEIAALDHLLAEAVEDFAPVAEMKGVRIGLDRSSLNIGVASLVAVKLSEAQMATILFRLLDSILSVAARGTWLRIATESLPDWVCMQFEWQAQEAWNEASVAGLGLLVAQARLEGAGAEWTREGKQDRETLMVRLPCGSS